MSKDGDHHYVPKFHLRSWEGPDGQIKQWSRIEFNDKLVYRPVHAAATAYQPGLYSLSHVPEPDTQIVERDVFGKIDRMAKPVLMKLFHQGTNNLSFSERYWWAVYLNASAFRVPHVVAAVKIAAKEALEKELADDIPEYQAIKGDAPEETLFAWAAKNAPGKLANSGLNVLVKLLAHKKAIDRIVQLHWQVKDISFSARTLLLGDNPFVRVGGVFESNALISIPLSPTKIFFGSDNLETINFLSNLPDREIVKACNISTLRSAKKYVYGNAERGFIDVHFRRMEGSLADA